MSPIAVPDLSDQETDEFVASTLEELKPRTEVPSPRRRGKLRELLRPQANGDQDAW